VKYYENNSFDEYGMIILITKIETTLELDTAVLHILETSV
jgi:hypothetical protein